MCDGFLFILWKHKYTVTELANSCFTPLFWHLQDPQGCLKQQNYPLRWNLGVWCAKNSAKIELSLKNFRNHKKTSKNDGFGTVFQSFLVLGPILAHQTTKFKLSGWFCFSRHPWDPWGRLNSGVTQELAKSVTVIIVIISKILLRNWPITDPITKMRVAHTMRPWNILQSNQGCNKNRPVL